MGGRPQPDITERLLDACVGHALTHGLPDRLEPLAAAAGTSERMRIYHFGTRDALLRAVLGHARQRQSRNSALCCLACTFCGAAGSEKPTGASPRFESTFADNLPYVSFMPRIMPLLHDLTAGL